MILIFVKTFIFKDAMPIYATIITVFVDIVMIPAMICAVEAWIILNVSIVRNFVEMAVWIANNKKEKYHMELIHWEKGTIN